MIPEYECLDCGHHFDEALDWEEGEELHCPRCGGKNLRRETYYFGEAGEEPSEEEYFEVIPRSGL